MCYTVYADEDSASMLISDFDSSNRPEYFYILLN